MKPVSSDNLSRILKDQPTLILNETCFGPSYVDYVFQDPSMNISTKKGKITLPPEIWLQILALATSKSRSDVYRMVQPWALLSTDHGMMLTCNLVKEWHPCGKLMNGTHVHIFESYFSSSKNEMCKLGDKLVISRPEDKDSVINIPVSILNSRYKVLFDHVTVPDVIARIESGECRFCNKTRTLCPGCEDGKDAIEAFRLRSVHGDCDCNMLCPLCVGVGWAQESLWRYDRYMEGYDENLLEDDDYVSQVKERQTELDG